MSPPTGIEYPPTLPVATRGPIDAVVHPPGSKSITNRALLAAALAEGDSVLAGALESDDTAAMRESLRALGANIDDSGDEWTVKGTAGRLRTPSRPLDARASGTTARFLTAAATLADGAVVVDGSPRLRQRPIADLADALRELGAAVEVLGREGCPPVLVGGGGLEGGSATIDASRSSQFVSAVMLAAPYARRDVELIWRGGVLVSRPYVGTTAEVMRAFGAEVGLRGDGVVVAAGGYRACRYTVEADASAAVYAFAAAAITGGRVRVEGIDPDSTQADLGVLDVLAAMGCAVRRGEGGITVSAPAGGLRAVEVDMNDMPDAVLAVAVTALFARGTTTIRNVANLRLKESDRLGALETELRRLGAQANAGDDHLVVEPAELQGAEIDTYDDHRMAMSFALAGLRVPGVVIRDPGCVAKTWPDFFEMLAAL